MQIFNRLIGLETEYALRFRPWPGSDRPTDYELYHFLVGVLRRKLPTAAASNVGQGKLGLFLANGGAVWFERSRFAGQTGLLEGSTPECRDPRQLLICQRAQDRLLAETARDAEGAGTFALIKNCRDARGQVYGAQENYEVVLARGWRLAAWRIGWVVFYPLVCLYFAVLFLFLIGLLGSVLLLNALIGGLIYGTFCAVARPAPERRRAWRIALFGGYIVTHDDADAPWPAWVEAPLFFLLQAGLAPLFLLISGLVALTDLRQTQQRLLPFLASRALIGGSGWLDAQGHFHVTEKAETRRAIWLELLPDASRPVFSLSPFCKMISTFPPRWRELLAPRQRMQLSLGDSNRCEEAEYLRIATTALVLDAIEAGALPAGPVLRRPLAAFHQISRDPTLATTVAVRGGKALTALQLQRWYLDGCRRFVDRSARVPPEAREVLDRWADVLDRLEMQRRSLVGRLDWVTKQFLLDNAGADLPHAARKKIDLRYHELLAQGYFSRLEAAGGARYIVTEEEVEKAMRLPPAASPAMRRARYIREFSGSNTILKVSWRFIEVLMEGGKKTTIDLHEPPIGEHKADPSRTAPETQE